jgi:dimethylglycine dehydrogenase
VGRELSIEYAGFESALERFIDLKKGDFLGREALLAWRDKAFANRLVTLEMQGILDADARGSEPVMRDGAPVGRTTSGGYGWRTGKSLALAMVQPEHAQLGTQLQVQVLGETRSATVIGDSPFDPENSRLRG